MLNNPSFSSNKSCLDLNNIPHTTIYTNFFPYNRKTITDFWSLRYDIEKENEQVYFLKKQNLSQIKNIIDETLKLRKKSKFLNHEKYRIIQEKKNYINKTLQIKKDKIMEMQKKIEKLIDKAERKEREEEFNKECKLRKEIEQIKEKKKNKKQKELIEKQKKWEKENNEHMIKVEDIETRKHQLKVKEYLQLLKKGLKRYEKIDERKNEINRKNQIKNEERNIYLINYKIKTKQIENKIRKKFEKRQNNISRFYFLQKEIKKEQLEKKKKKREEKVKNNIMNRLVNKSMEKQRRNKLLDLFEEKEEKIAKRMMLNQMENEEYKLNNLIKSDEILDNYIRQNNILRNKNMMKLQRMRNKDIEVDNKILRRQNSAINRIARYDRIKMNKDLMMQQVKEILEDGKDIEPNYIYKQVFTNEEIKLLHE